MVKENNTYYNLIKKNAIGAQTLHKKTYPCGKKYNDKCKTAKSLISKIKDPKIKAFFNKELDSIENNHTGGALDIAKVSAMASSASDFRKSSLGRIAETAIKSTPMGAVGVRALDKVIANADKIVEKGTKIAESAGIDKKMVGDIVNKGTQIANRGIDDIATTAATAVNKSKDLSDDIAKDPAIQQTQDADQDDGNADSNTEVKKDGNNISVKISVKGSGVSPSKVQKPPSDQPETIGESTPEIRDSIPSEQLQTSESTPAEEMTVERPTMLEDKESEKKQQTPPYPQQLQIIPLDPHVSKKTSNVYSAYLEKLKTKIDEASNIEASQNELVKKKQEKIDEENKKTQTHLQDVAMESDKNYIKILTIVQKSLSDIIQAIWNVIKTMAIFFYRCIYAFIVFCSTHPVGLICAIIAAIIVILLLTWFVFGVDLKYNSDPIKTNEPGDGVNGVSGAANDYNSSGQSKTFDFWDCFNNPSEYTFNFFKDGAKKIKSSTILNKLFYNSASALGDTVSGITGISLIDKYKLERPIHKKNGAQMQRVNNISYIDYSLLNNKIKKDIYLTTVPSDDHVNTAISLIKPKNIEWKFPYIDYYTHNTDANLLPESIKRYKDKNNPTAYSLNDTNTLIFEWNREGNEYVLNCNPKFKDLNINKSSDLYIEDSPNHCRQNFVPNTKFSGS